jgi:hypothetical protein
MCTLPKRERNRQGIDIETAPPRRFITLLVKLAMMQATNRNSEFIADLATQRPRLRKAKMMRIGKPFVRCRIWDISEDRARLAVAHPTIDLPHQFTLSWFKGGSAKRDCEMVWTDKRFVAVSH